MDHEMSDERGPGGGSGDAHTNGNTSAEPNRGGAPKGNVNRQRHGLRSAMLPKDAKYIQNAVNRLRRDLEDAVGETTIYQAALISSCVRHEKRAQLCERWLRIGGDELPLQERLSLLKTISDATDSRDKCIERLKIDRSDSDPWDSLYSGRGIVNPEGGDHK